MELPNRLKPILEQLKTNQIDTSTFCTFPFFQLAIKEWTGSNEPSHIAPCCNAIGVNPNPMQFDLQEVRKDFTMQKVFHSKEFDQLRADLLKGIKNTACTYCWKLEEEGSYSPRHLSIEYMVDALDTMDVKQVIDNPKLAAIDTNFDNHCNLKCRMCSPNNSARLGDDLAEVAEQGLYIPINLRGFQENRQQVVLDFTYAMRDTAFVELIAISDQLRGARIAGGEPTVSQYFWKWMDHLETNDLKKNITLHLTTNGTKFNKRFFDAINGFKSVELIVSIDGVGPAYDYLRYPFHWAKVKSNIEELMRVKHERIKVTIVYIVNALTLPSIPELIQWVSTMRGINLDANVFLRPEDSPLSAKWLPKNLLYKYIDDIEWAIAGRDPLVIEKTEWALENLRHFLTVPINVNKQREFKRDVIIFDRIRKQSYRDYLDPLLVQYLDRIDLEEEFLLNDIKE